MNRLPLHITCLVRCLLFLGALSGTEWAKGQAPQSPVSDTQTCSSIISIPATPPSSGKVDLLTGPIVDPYYSTYGTEIFSSFDSTGNGSYTTIPTSNSFWVNNNGSNGPLNRCGVWSTITSDNQSIGFSVCVTINSEKDYYVGFGVDNYATLKIDAQVIIQQAPTAGQENLNVWRIYKIHLTQGTHYIEILGNNPYGPASIGFEIYDNTLSQIINATSYNDLNLVFSSKDQIGKPVQDGDPTLTYSCPDGYSLNYCSSNIPLCSKKHEDTLTVQPPVPSCNIDTVDITAPLITQGSSTDLAYTYWKDTLATVPIPTPNAIPISGTYYILGQGPGGCSITIPIKVTILTKPKAGFSINTSHQCFNGNYYVFTNTTTDSAGSVSSQWSWGDGGTSTVSSPSHTYTAAGDYAVHLVTTDADGCQDSTIQTIQVYPNPLPTLSPSGMVTFCEGDSVHITSSLLPDTGITYGYAWYKNGVLVPAPGGIAQDIDISQPGTYALKVSNNDGCDTLLTLEAKENYKTYFAVDTAFCQGQSYKGYNASGSYTQKYTGSNGCDSLWSLHLTVYPNPFTIIDTAICEGGNVGGYTTAGTHTDVFPSFNGCDSTRTYNLTVNPLPNPHLGSPDTAICTGQSITLTPGNFLSYLWQDSSTRPSLTISQKGSYHVTVTNDCGATTTEIMVMEGPCYVQFPSAFTPNGDGFNDQFKGLNGYNVKDYRLVIVNRWGQQVFETSDIGSGWNGDLNGKRAPVGTYVWFCHFTKPGDVYETKLSGTLALIK